MGRIQAAWPLYQALSSAVSFLSFFPSQDFPQPNADGSRTPHHFPALDSIRGIAALWVVLYHAHTAGHISQLTRALPNAIRLVLFDWGYLGVPIFFTLSGFVIAHSLFERPLSLGGFKTFMVRRLIRLTPAYWASILITLALSLASNLVRAEALEFPSPFALASHLVFLQDLLHQPAISPIYWTLGIEMQFYALFYGLLWLNQKLQFRAPAQSDNPSENPVQRASQSYRSFLLLAAAIALPGLAAAPQLLSWGKFFLPYWYCFLLGILTHWSLYRRIPYGWLLALLAACGFLAMPLPGEFPTYLASGGLIISLIGLARLDWLSRGTGMLLQNLGNLSYSVYLIHGAVFGPVFFLRQKLLGSAPLPLLLTDLLSLSGAIALTYATAALLCRWIEQPSLQWSRRLRPSSMR